MSKLDTDNKINWSNGSVAVGRLRREDMNMARLYSAEEAAADRYLWRALDLLFSVGGLLITAVLFPFIAIAIKLNSPGPVFYSQRRTGFRGEEFTCWKFRTMEPDSARSNGGTPDVASLKDGRVFAVGRFLRRTFLDEWPQLWNVLKGEMSLIGPRPYPVKEADYWHREFPDHFKRYAAKPGITGLAQVRGYRGGTLNHTHMRRRLAWDLYYVRNKSTALNAYILGQTLLIILGIRK